MIKKLISKFQIFFLIQTLIVLFLYFRPDLFERTWLKSAHFTMEIMLMLPPILLIMALLDAWTPSSIVSNHLGTTSGVTGWLTALALGSFAAGPLYAAFPMAVSMARKGARTSNVVIFLSSWGTIKVPMLLMEARFVGLKFAVLRFLLTAPLIILIGLIMERLTTIDQERL